MAIFSKAENHRERQRLGRSRLAAHNRTDPYAAVRATLYTPRDPSSVHLIVSATLEHSAHRSERRGLGPFLPFARDLLNDSSFRRGRSRSARPASLTPHRPAALNAANIAKDTHSACK